MENKNIKLSLQNRMIAVQLKQARLQNAKSIQDCASILNINESDYENFESGLISPSLPELEVLSFVFDRPIQLFFESDLSSDSGISPEKIKMVVELRTKIIATKMMVLRNEKEMSINDVSSNTGILVSDLQDYETCEKKIPYVEFDALCKLYGLKTLDFVSQDNLIGQINSEKEEFNNYLKLPEDLRSFVSKPINQLYLELAKKLSDTDVEKLRSLAENLLEITF